MRYIVHYPSAYGPDVDLFDAGPMGEMAALAERAGWHGFALTEHPAPSARWLRAGGHQSVDPFVALAHVAAMTSDLTLLTHLSVLPYRNPLLLAKAAATLDRLSDGRFVLGVGVGYLKSEYHALGVDFDERNALFDEALEVLPLHWAGEPFDYAGRHFSAREVQALPRPTQQPIPIWIGGNSRLTLRRVAARAQGWMPLLSDATTAATARSPHLGTLGAVRERLELLTQLAGDRAAELTITLSYNGDGIDDPGREVERHRHALAEYEELGVDWVVVGAPSGPAPQAQEFLEAFAESYIRSGL